MAKKQTKAMMALSLKDIVAAGAEGLFVPQETAKNFYEEGFISVDGDKIDEYDCILVTATDKGVAYLNEVGEESGLAEPSEFVLETGIVMPAKRTGSNRGSKYPFEAMGMNENQSFMVKGDVEATMKTLSSAVAVANRRFSQETGEFKMTKGGNSVPVRVFDRKFAARKVEGGVRVFRIQ